MVFNFWVLPLPFLGVRYAQLLHNELLSKGSRGGRYARHSMGEGIAAEDWRWDAVLFVPPIPHLVRASVGTCKGLCEAKEWVLMSTVVGDASKGDTPYHTPYHTTCLALLTPALTP